MKACRSKLVGSSGVAEYGTRGFLNRHLGTMNNSKLFGATAGDCINWLTPLSEAVKEELEDGTVHVSTDQRVP